MIKKDKMKSAFTLIELLVVIAIVALLATTVVVAFFGTRVNSRDTARLSDVNRIRTALDLYWQARGVYPDVVLPETPIKYNGITFMASVPRPPEPTDDGDCPLLEGDNNEYVYSTDGTGGSMTYTISFCLGNGGNYIGTTLGITEAPPVE